MTSAGLAENIKRELRIPYCTCHIKMIPELHLQEYFRDKFAYLQAFEQRPLNPFCPLKLMAFSNPCDVNGYDSKSISDEMITEAYLEYSNRTRRIESKAYLRTRTGE
jgi:hypothetical protein